MIGSRVTAILLTTAACTFPDHVPTGSGTTGSSSSGSEATSAAFDDGYEVDTGAEGCAFACPDPAAPPNDGNDGSCDIWSRDCDPGFKCMPWANDGGGRWNATRCSPLDPLPALIGAPCTVEGSAVSGLDDCELGSMCWGVDPETNVGVCVAACLGSPSAPLCTDPTLTCVVANDGVLAVCLPACDPFTQDCPDGEGCYPIGDVVACLPSGGPDTAALGEPCASINSCAPGLACGPCVDGSCCASWCDLLAPMPEAACEPGQSCMPLNRAGQGPPALQHVGTCGAGD